ncbi:HAD-like protein [Crepidotus variabilis]|uniref:HAD-like protein n=1 Tax=Crepidotus variabilis TaxID=179855 RepID=A0A9P6E6E9_9AGAR|nr:HAD-like protein [Crepidotus variabilis]
MTFQTIYADAALFDMDGTLTDSIAAVEAAWDQVAREIGQDPKLVIAATHGKRAIDNLSHFKPHIRIHEMEAEVARFEETILYFADAHQLHISQLPIDEDAKEQSQNGTETPLSESILSDASPLSSDCSTPSETSRPTSPFDNLSQRPTISRTQSHVRNASFPSRMLELLSAAAIMRQSRSQEEDEIVMDSASEPFAEHLSQAVQDAWKLEACKVDRAVQILPGVKSLLESIPEGRYAVATSGAKTYAFGCMKRVGITPPAVTITADDKRLKAGKPAPDPFLLAAECLGFDAARCVVFEDSPSGIRAGVASGATVIAVCTSHERQKIQDCGAHFIAETLDSVRCVQEDGRLKFTISS